jgi:putative transposase
MDYTALTCLDEIGGGGRALKLPNLDAPIKMAEPFRHSGKILAVAISRKADQRHASTSVEADAGGAMKAYRFPESESQAAGVDLGAEALAALPDGTAVQGSKAAGRYAAQLARAQKSPSRKIGAKKDEKKSSSCRKRRKRAAKMHRRITDSRRDTLHKPAAFPAAAYSVIGIEGLNIKGMLANHKLAKHIADGAFYEFKRQLPYKADATGAQPALADPLFPSSKACSRRGAACGGLKLSEREWARQSCGARRHRDVNAAYNLEKMALAKLQAN